MNDNNIVKEYEINKPLIQKVDSLIDISIRDCHNKYIHTFDHICEYDINSTNIDDSETISYTISDKSMGLYELNKKLTIARQKGFIFNQINNFKIKFYSNLSHRNIHYHLILGASPLHRQFFRRLAQNRDYIQTHCNNRRNLFHFACRQWYSYNIPRILT